MEGAWPVLIDALTASPRARRTSVLIRGLLAINGAWMALVGIFMLGRWIVLGETPSLGLIGFLAAYTLLPTVIFLPAYALWRRWESRPRAKAPPPLKLD